MLLFLRSGWLQGGVELVCPVLTLDVVTVLLGLLPLFSPKKAMSLRFLLNLLISAASSPLLGEPGMGQKFRPLDSNDN